jgi:hypothetical protein
VAGVADAMQELSRAMLAVPTLVLQPAARPALSPRYVVELVGLATRGMNRPCGRCTDTSSLITVLSRFTAMLRCAALHTAHASQLVSCNVLAGCACQPACLSGLRAGSWHRGCGNGQHLGCLVQEGALLLLRAPRTPPSTQTARTSRSTSSRMCAPHGLMSTACWRCCCRCRCLPQSA